ncbi:MAG: ArsB/NhaD family transporter, partial [Xanthobacteraceae bacterium]
LPSVAAILITYLLLRLTQRAAIDQKISGDFQTELLSVGGKCVAVGIALTAVALLGASSLDRQLGLPTFIAGTVVTIIVLIISRQSPLPVLRDISWGVLPLVAGLFILVAGVEQTGILSSVTQTLRDVAAYSPGKASFGAGIIVAFASNLMNNLPTGLVAATVSQSADVSLQVTSGILIGVDLGPNLSVTGSLATILWLIALRREGEAVTAWQFLKLGIVVMPPALVAALLAITP